MPREMWCAASRVARGQVKETVPPPTRGAAAVSEGPLEPRGVSAGMNQFIWNLQYEAPEAHFRALSFTSAISGGPIASVGQLHGAPDIRRVESRINPSRC